VVAVRRKRISGWISTIFRFTDFQLSGAVENEAFLLVRGLDTVLRFVSSAGVSTFQSDFDLHFIYNNCTKVIRPTILRREKKETVWLLLPTC
jgi:hypothetical protein